MKSAMKINIFFESLKSSLSSCTGRFMLFTAIIIIQIIFLASFFFASVHYQSKILDSLQSINSYVSRQEASEIDMTKNILEQEDVFGPDPQLITREFESIRKTFGIYVFVSFLIFVFFTSLIYSLSYKITRIGKTGFASNFAKSAAVVSFCFAIIFGLFYWITDSSFSSPDSSGLVLRYMLLLAVSGAVSYFMVICLFLVGRNSIEQSAKKSLYLGIKKMNYFITSIAVFWAVILLLCYSASYLLETDKMPLISFMLIALALILWVFSRLFVMNMVERLEN
jgi:hypothetical protein